MNIAGMGPQDDEEGHGQQNVTSLAELIDTAREQGVKIIACTMSMDVMGLKRGRAHRRHRVRRRGHATSVTPTRPTSTSSSRPSPAGAPHGATGTASMETSIDGLRRPGHRQRDRRHGVVDQARRHGLQGAAGGEGGQRRRTDDPAQQGLPDPRLRQLHLRPEDVLDDQPPEHHHDDLQRGDRASGAATDGRFTATVQSRSRRFVDWAACTGCQRLRDGAAPSPCPTSSTPTSSARRAAYIAFPQAVPKKAVLEREGTSPCIGACPAGIKAHGYVSLVRERQVRGGVPARAGRDAARRHARTGLLRAVRDRVHAHQARGPGADPADQAVRRRPALRRTGDGPRRRGRPRRTARRSPSWAPVPPA